MECDWARLAAAHIFSTVADVAGARCVAEFVVVCGGAWIKVKKPDNIDNHVIRLYDRKQATRRQMPGFL